MENVMVDIDENSESGRPELVLKLTDFGFSCVMEPDKKPTLKLGSPFCMAPEMFEPEQCYDSKVDIWALGVLVYQLLSQKLPFDGRTKFEIKQKILTEEPDFTCFDRYRKKTKIKDFLSHCLDKNPNTRNSA